MTITADTDIINPNISDDQIYDLLESRLKLYTGLWFASLTSENWNLQYTAILMEIFKTKTLMDLISCVKKY